MRKNALRIQSSFFALRRGPEYSKTGSVRKTRFGPFRGGNFEEKRWASTSYESSIYCRIRL